jgi:hypothetical protein
MCISYPSVYWDFFIVKVTLINFKNFLNSCRSLIPQLMVIINGIVFAETALLTFNVGY